MRTTLANCSAERRLWLMVVGVGVSVAGCGVADAAATTIEMGPANRFEPATITVAAGTEVIWHNESTTVHTVTTDGAVVPAARVPEGAGTWDSGPVEPSETVARRFHESGDHVFACAIHGQDGMVGVVRVVDR